MITKIRLECFKRFANETFTLDDDIVLAGPNNSGKTTLLQAVAAWNLGLQRWLAEHAESSTAKQRTGVPITRKDFTSIPLREMNLLWHDRDTAYGKEEKPGMSAGQPKNASISLWGRDSRNPREWSVTVAFRY
ncbi:MAG: AAA family ATPase, partial [Candidatus Sumerlaeota bacterium]|nr:AAA family ATPase [Candidatus Sumerlaeota bacterium]